MKCLSRALIHSVALSTSLMCFISSFVPRWFNGWTEVLKNKERASFHLQWPFLFFPTASRLLPTFTCLLEFEKNVMAHRGADDYFPLHSSPRPTSSSPSRPSCHQSPHQSLPEPVCVCSHGLFVLITRRDKERVRWSEASVLSPSQENKRTSSWRPVSFFFSLFASFLQDTKPCKKFPVVDLRAWQCFSAALSTLSVKATKSHSWQFKVKSISNGGCCL